MTGKSARFLPQCLRCFHWRLAQCAGARIFSLRLDLPFDRGGSVANRQSDCDANAECAKQDRNGITPYENLGALSRRARFLFGLLPRVARGSGQTTVACLESAHVSRCASGNFLIKFVASWINHTKRFRISRPVRAASPIAGKFTRFILAK